MVVTAILLLSLGPATIYAQEPSPRFEQFTPQSGLTSGTIYDIIQDSQGFMWFGTWNGLNKYDGYQFAAYQHNPADPTSLSHNTINTLYEDANGILWIGTEQGGLNKFDPATETFTAYRHDPADPHSLSDDGVHDIIAADDGRTLWLGTYGGLNKFDPARSTSQPNRWVANRMKSGIIKW
jgi:ligand-binding sensor domain-containing protein